MAVAESEFARRGLAIGEAVEILSMNHRATYRMQTDRPAPSLAPAGQNWVADNRSSVLLTAFMTVLFVYMVVSWDFILLPSSGGGSMAANPVTRAVKLGLLVFGSTVVIWRMSVTWLMLRHINVFFSGFLVLVLVSAYWSIDRGATIARFVSMFTIFAACLAFTIAGWHARRLQNVLRPVITVLLVWAIIFGLVRPDLGIMTSDNQAWRGIFGQKNPFGQMASFGMIFWFHAGIARETKTWKALAGCAVAGTCLVLSKSSTSIFATSFAMMLLLMLLRSPPNFRRYMPYASGVFAGIVLLYALTVLKLVPGLEILLTPVTALTGKDQTFSNRSEIWNIIKEHIQLSPYIGSGYGAYWTGPEPTSPSFVFLSRMYFYPTQSHNGYLELANDLGFLGLGWLFGYLIVYVRQSLQLFQVDRPQGALFLALFFQQAIINLSESCWLSLASVSFLVMAPATMALARALLDQKFIQLFGEPEQTALR